MPEDSEKSVLVQQTNLLSGAAEVVCLSACLPLVSSSTVTA
jgi:hypothetical protein